MNGYREIELGADGLNYVRKCLKLGKTLSKLLLEIHDLNAGRIVTRLPEGVDDKAAKEFETGGKLPELYPRMTNLQPVPNTDLFLVEQVHRFLEEGDTGLCVFEDASASRSDPFLQSLNARYSTFEDEVYYLLCQADKDDETILRTVREAHSWLSIGVMTSTSGETGPCPEGRALTVGHLRLLAEKTEKITIGAYDGEGYLIWSKSG